MQSLARWIKRSPLAPRDAVGWVLRIARGIVSLHQMGVAHGRISAGAFFAEGAGCDAEGMMLDVDRADRLVTFMSARRARERGATPDDDIWALGVLLYEMVTGALPFPGEDRWTVRERIEWRPASPIEVYDVNELGLQRLLDRLLSTDDGERLRTVAALEEAVLELYPDLAGLSALEFGDPPGFEPAASPAPASVRPAAVAARTAEDGGEQPACSAEPAGPDTTDQQADVGDARPAAVGRDAGSPRPRRPRASAAVWLWVAAPALAGALILALWWRHRGPPVRPAGSRAPRGASAGGSAPSRPVVRADGAASRLAPRVGAEWATAETASAPPSGAPEAGSGSGGGAPGPAGSAQHRLPACVSALFPPATFAAAEPRFAFLCSEADPRRGADALQTEIVLGKGGRAVTPAMHEWARLGWYQLALFAVVRAGCCTAAPPMESVLGGEPCRLDASLTDLGQAVVYGSETEYDDALARYGAAARCIVAAHGARAYGERDASGGPERIAFDGAARRVRAAVGRGGAASRSR